MWLSRRRLAILGAQIATIAVLVALWQELVQYKVVSPVLVAPPSDAFPAFWATMHLKLPANVPFGFAQTLALVAVAVAVVVAIGIAGGVVIGYVTFIQNVLEEYMVALYSLPKVALLPMFWFIFGLSLEYRVAFGIFSGVFPVTLIMIYAVKSVDPVLLKMSRSVGASKLQSIRKVYLPSVVPSILAAVRIGFISTFTGVLLAEMYAGNSGIGYLVRDFTALFAVTYLYDVVLATLIISVVVNVALLLLERHLTRWRAALPI